MHNIMYIYIYYYYHYYTPGHRELEALRQGPPAGEEVGSRRPECLGHDLRRLSDAFRAAYWRLIRWSLRDFGTAPEPQIVHLQAVLQAAARAMQSGTIGACFGEVARLESQLIEPRI